MLIKYLTWGLTNKGEQNRSNGCAWGFFLLTRVGKRTEWREEQRSGFGTVQLGAGQGLAHWLPWVSVFFSIKQMLALNLGVGPFL